jgi:hypothetical protein
MASAFGMATKGTLVMNDEHPTPKPVSRAGRRKPPSGPPRIALGFDDSEDEDGRCETISCENLVMFDDLAINFPAPEQP